MFCCCWGIGRLYKFLSRKDKVDVDYYRYLSFYVYIILIVDIVLDILLIYLVIY